MTRVPDAGSAARSAQVLGGARAQVQTQALGDLKKAGAFLGRLDHPVELGVGHADDALGAYSRRCRP